MTARDDKRLFAALSHVRAHVLGKQWMQLRSLQLVQRFSLIEHGLFHSGQLIIC